MPPCLHLHWPWPARAPSNWLAGWPAGRGSHAHQLLAASTGRPAKAICKLHSSQIYIYLQMQIRFACQWRAVFVRFLGSSPYLFFFFFPPLKWITSSGMVSDSFCGGDKSASLWVVFVWPGSVWGYLWAHRWSGQTLRWSRLALHPNLGSLSMLVSKDFSPSIYGAWENNCLVIVCMDGDLLIFVRTCAYCTWPHLMNCWNACLQDHSSTKLHLLYRKCKPLI